MSKGEGQGGGNGPEASETRELVEERIRAGECAGRAVRSWCGDGV